MTACPQPQGTPHNPLYPRQRASSYRLVSATTTIFLVRAFRRTSATAVCPTYLVFTLCHHVLYSADDHLCIAVNLFRRAYRAYSARSPLTTDDVLPLGTAMRPLGAARIKTRVRTLLNVFQRVSEEAPPRRRTNLGCLKIIRTRSNQIYEELVSSTPIFFLLALSFSTRVFSEKSKTIIGNDLRVTLFPGKKKWNVWECSSANFRGKFVTRFLHGNFFIITKKRSSGGRDMKRVSTYSTGILPNRLGRRYLLFSLDLHHNQNIHHHNFSGAVKISPIATERLHISRKKWQKNMIKNFSIIMSLYSTLCKPIYLALWVGELLCLPAVVYVSSLKATKVLRLSTYNPWRPCLTQTIMSVGACENFMCL